MENMVEAKNLSRSFGGFHAVRGIDFRIKKGECYGFLGPNGAGKTTIVRMIQGFLPVTGGSLSVMGKDIKTDATYVKEKLGVVPQENNLDRDLTVLQNLVTYARYFDIPEKEALSRAKELLTFLQLEEKKDDLLTTLSGGMQRRLAIARSLTNNPQLLMLDEPTTGLDPQARRLIWQRLSSLKKEGATLILTTHYMEEAERLCDRVAIMNEGKILMEGSPRELVRKHIGEETVELRIEDDIDTEILEKIKKTGANCERYGDTVYVYCKDGSDFMATALEIKHKSALHRKASLEDLFLHLAGRTLAE